MRIKQASQILQVSEDTLRRWADSGRCDIAYDDAGRSAITGVQLAALCRDRASEDDLVDRPVVNHSVRNRFTGVVTKIIKDTVMAQIEVQAGPHRIVSLVSREAADDLGLEVGSIVVAAVKSTNVSIEVPVG